MSKDFEEKVLKSLNKIENNVKRLEVLQEETTEKIDQIIETVSPSLKKINEHGDILEDHESRIKTLEVA